MSSDFDSGHLIVQGQFSVKSETLTGNKTLTTSDLVLQWLDPNGADRTVTLPAEASSTNLMFIILNTADGAGEDLVVQDDTPATVATLGPGMTGIFSCNGTSWKWENAVDYKLDTVAQSTIFPLVNDAATPTIAFGDGDSGIFEYSDDIIHISLGGATRYIFTTSYIYATSGSGIRNTPPSSTTPNILPYIDDSNTGIGRAGEDLLSLIAGGTEGIRIEAAKSTFAGTIQGATISDQFSNKLAADLLGILTAPKFLYTWQGTPGNGLTESDLSGAGHTATYTGAGWAAADQLYKGFGYVLDPDGTVYLNLGDSDDFSFGDGLNDVAFSIGGVIEVVNTAASQVIASKKDITTGVEVREWIFYIDSNEKLNLRLTDESANVECHRLTNSALSVGFHTFFITYDGSGGATAANGITIYVDGAVVASTATNDASYVAMENLATPCWIGAYKNTDGVAANFMTGDIGCLFLDKGYVWSAADIWRMHLILKSLYNL